MMLVKLVENNHLTKIVRRDGHTLVDVHFR